MSEQQSSSQMVTYYIDANGNLASRMTDVSKQPTQVPEKTPVKETNKKNPSIDTPDSHVQLPSRQFTEGPHPSTNNK